MSLEDTKGNVRILDINMEFLEKLIGRDISSFSLEAGSNPGDNYLSVMHAVTINFKNEDDPPAYIVIKCIPNHPTRREFTDESNVFRKEFFIYDFWIPTLEKLQVEIGANPKLELAVAPYIGGKVTRPIPTNQTTNNSGENIFLIILS